MQPFGKVMLVWSSIVIISSSHLICAEMLLCDCHMCANPIYVSIGFHSELRLASVPAAVIKDQESGASFLSTYFFSTLLIH